MRSDSIGPAGRRDRSRSRSSSTTGPRWAPWSPAPRSRRLLPILDAGGGRRSAIALVLALAISSLGAARPVCERVVAVGDLHGGHDAFRLILRETGLLDEQDRWMGGGACLVQLGDAVDRGDRATRELLDFMMHLEKQAPERVRFLLGNHEVMNVVGDLRDVTREEFAAFAEEEAKEERERGWQAFSAGADASILPEDERRRVFETSHPAGWFAHRRVFSPEGRYGRWLLSQPAIVKLGRTLFVHGGIGPEDATRGIEALNREIPEGVTDYVRLRRSLVQSGLLDPFAPFAAGFDQVGRWVSGNETPAAADLEPGLTAIARRFLERRGDPWVRSDGPLWDRSLAKEDELRYLPTLLEILEALGVDRIVVGHTPQDDHRIRPRFEGRVILIDTGAGPAYGGHVSALEIRDGKTLAVYPGRSEALPEPRPSDGEIERFLLNGRITEAKEIGKGITRPKKVTLELDGRVMHAAFKYVDVHDTGLTRFPDGSEVNFSDRYHYERAAYLLDRELGLHMVPVSVIREIDGQSGALTEWVSGAVNEATRRHENLKPDDPVHLIRQRAIMDLFDALILNKDRNLSNQLITLDDWKLHLIDHSRSFRVIKKLPDGYRSQPARVPRFLLERLRALEEQRLRELFRDLLSRTQVRALVARRNKILAKIEADVEAHGEAMIISD